MKRTLVYRGLRYGYRLFKKAYHYLNQSIQSKNDRLLFVFAGRAEEWPTLGRSFYEKYPVFATSIKQSNQMLIKCGGAEILSYFEEPVNEQYFNDESKFTCITAIQIATITLYNKLGYHPNAVMGVSMGEPAAAFAAGALSAEEALKVAASYMSLHKIEDTNYKVLYLNADYNKVTELCKTKTIRMEVIYEDNTNGVLIACHMDDINDLKSILKNEQIDYKLLSEKALVPYHTSLIKKHKQHLFEFYKDIVPRPLQCDYYSPTLGKLIPKHTILEPHYWHHLACTSVFFNQALQHVINDEYKTFLQIGPAAISERQFSNVVDTNRINVLHTFQKDSDEINHHESIIKNLRKRKFDKTFASETNDKIVLNEYLKSFDVNAIANSAEYDYLRNNGPVHFLPKHNAWMVLGYDNTDFILKNPAIFSSSPYDFIDHVLMGANPESHKIMRGILQPLFSSQAIAEVSEKTLVIADDLLNSVLNLNEFDLVKDFSDPLSQKVICGFMGFTAAEEQKVIEVLGRDYHNSMFFGRLADHFKNDFDLESHENEPNFLGTTYAAIKSGQITREDSASLLRIILSAGIATTSTVISTILKNFKEMPEYIEQLKNNDQLTSKYIEECLRLETPAHYVRRITAKPVEISGVQLPENSFIYVNLRSANRDPLHFPDPLTFSITRPAKRNLVFGSGIHQCIGMGISRAEARSAIQVALLKFEKLEEYTWDIPDYFRDSEVQAMTTLMLKKRK